MKKMDSVMRTFNDMITRKIEPTISVYNAVLDACAQNQVRPWTSYMHTYR